MIDIRSGEKKGRHDGLMYYTLGQRQGLGIGGSGSGSGEPWFVADKDLERNILYVVQGEDHPSLYSESLIATGMNWILPDHGTEAIRCTAKFRYRQPDQGVTVTMKDNGEAHIVFDKPQKAITPGQAVVLYDGDICLGGGTIDKVQKVNADSYSAQQV
ncbi:tRNA-specific 2-thiouridylase MnmA [compost metagenome]